MTSIASPLQPPLELTPAQAAAAAKVAFAIEPPGAIAVLCGPAGVGKTTVLEHLARAAARSRQSVRVTTLAALGGDSGGIAAEGGDQARSASGHDILLVDDAHDTDVAGLVALVAGVRRRQPTTAVVLAGEGRLLSLVAGDSRLEQSVRLRATLPAFSFADTCRLLAGRLAAGSAGGPAEGVLRTIHEIAGGVPTASLRLAEVADMLAAATSRPLVADDIETIHRRLSLSAA